MTLAYIDSFAGLIPCRVLSIETEKESAPLSINYIRVKVTARASRAYEAGQILELTGRAVVPRHAVRRSRGRLIIMPYAWKDCAPELFKGGKE
jgi:hypothetical protein